MATNTNPNNTRLSGSEKFLDVKVDLTGGKVAVDRFAVVKDRPNYATRLYKNYPKATDHVGAFVGSIFTPTTSPTWTIDELQDQVAIFYKTADVSTKITNGKTFYEVSNAEFAVLKIVSNTATDFTVSGTIPSGTTAAIVIEKAWLRIPQMSGYDFTDGTAQIDANDQDSGGYETFIDGLKSATLSGIAGHFYPSFPMTAQLRHAKLSGAIQEVRHGASDLKYGVVFNQMVNVQKFDTTGVMDKTGKLEYAIDFTNKDELNFETVLVNGTLPDFM